MLHARSHERPHALKPIRTRARIGALSSVHPTNSLPPPSPLQSPLPKHASIPTHSLPPSCPCAVSRLGDSLLWYAVHRTSYYDTSDCGTPLFCGALLLCGAWGGANYWKLNYCVTPYYGASSVKGVDLKSVLLLGSVLGGFNDAVVWGAVQRCPCFYGTPCCRLAAIEWSVNFSAITIDFPITNKSR